MLTERRGYSSANRSGRGAAVEVGEGVEGLQERVDEPKAERDRLKAAREQLADERDALEDDNERLQEQVAHLEADVQELRAAFESTFDVDVKVATATVGAVEEDPYVKSSPAIGHGGAYIGCSDGYLYAIGEQ